MLAKASKSEAELGVVRWAVVLPGKASIHDIAFALRLLCRRLSRICFLHAPYSWEAPGLGDDRWPKKVAAKSKDQSSGRREEGFRRGFIKRRVTRY